MRKESVLMLKMDFQQKFVKEGLTFDDVLLIPAESHVLPSEVDFSAQLTKTIRLNAPILTAAIREIREETGISLKEDALSIINPLLFSSPGMTDESNALVCAVANLSDLSSLSQKGAVGSERFDGFELLTPKAAREILLAGKDKDGIFYSVYTWAALMYFVSGLWR